MTTEIVPVGHIGKHVRRACPYNGLQPYTEDDSEYFFGRNGDRDLVIANLMASRLTVLYGPSGVGKSSLLQAGVMPHLRRLDDESFSYVATDQAIVVYHASWRDDPLIDLTESLRAALPDDLDPDIVPEGPLSADLLRAVTRRLDADVYLLCDQFEEETVYQEGAQADAFAAELGRIITAAGLRVNVLLGVREDALAKLDRLEAYVPDLFSNSLRLDHLSVTAAREAIERPLVRYNQEHPSYPVTIQAALVDRLLNELRTGRVSVTDGADGSSTASPSTTIETPFLQLVMMRLWSEETARGSRVLTESMLESLGGASRIVRTHLDSVMDRLTDEQQAIAAHVFRHLVTPSGTKIAHTAADLADYAGLSDSAQLGGVLEELASGEDRVLRPVPPPVDRPGPPRFEIFHDVMAPAVLDWRRRYVAEQDRLASKAALERAHRESEERHRRTKRRLRRSRLLSATLALLLVAVIAAVVYAKRSRAEGQAARNLAQSEHLVAASERLLSSDPPAALHSALQAYDKRHSPAAEAAVRAAFDSDNQLRVLKGHSGTVASSEFSPSGKLVVTAGWDGTARIFDAASGQVLHTLARAGQSRSQLTQASFSPDGHFVATAAKDGSVRVYTTAGGRLLGSWTKFKKMVAAKWMERDGTQMLLISSADYEFRWPAVLWDPSGARPPRYYGGSKLGAFDASPSPDGTLIVTDGLAPDERKMRVTVWDANSGKARAISTSFDYAAYPHFAGPTSGRIALVGRDSQLWWHLYLWDWEGASATPVEMTGAARRPSDITVSRDGTRVAMILDRAAWVYDAGGGSAGPSLIGVTSTQPDWIETANLSPDGQWLLTGDDGGLGQIWRADQFNDRPLAQFAGHRGAVLSAEFNPANPARLTTASTDGTSRIWTFGRRSLLTTSLWWVLDAAFSKDGHRIVTVLDDGVYQIWDAASRRMEKEWLGDNTTPGLGRSAQFTPAGDAVITATESDYSPKLWDTSTAKSRLTFGDSNERISSGAAVNTAGTRVAVGDFQNRVVQWDLQTGRIVSTSAPSSSGSFITAVSYIPNSNLIAAASADGTVRIWDAEYLDRPPRHVLSRSGSSLALALTPSPDGSQLAVVDFAHRISIWRVKQAQLVRQIGGPSTTVASASFSPDGHLIAVAGADAAVRIWDVRSGHPVATLRAHADIVNSVHFANDGIHVLTSSDDGTSALVTCDTCGSFQTVLAKARKLDGQS
jgi:WD40 repeat protein